MSIIFYLISNGNFAVFFHMNKALPFLLSKSQTNNNLMLMAAVRGKKATLQAEPAL